MAIAFDAVIEAGSAGVAQTNHTFATDNAAASDSIIWVFAHRFNSTNTTLTCSGGGLTWTAAPAGGVTSGNIRMYAFWAHAPSGLSAGTNITVNGSGGSNDYTVAAVSYTGADESALVTATNTGSGSLTAWTTGTVAGNSGDTYVGGAAGDGTLRTSTPTSPALERIDFNSATSSGSITVADEIGGSASDTVAGTWSGNLGHVRIGIAMAPAGGGSAVSREWQVTYNLIAPVVREWQLLYNLIAPASREWQLVYNLTNAISREWQLNYNLVAPVVREWVVTYNLIASISREWQLLYNLGDVETALIAELVSTFRGVWQPDVYTTGRRR